MNKQPQHVGIIMDGNGRWATARNLERCRGHEKGLETAEKIIDAVAKTDVKFLSLYVFSTENWKRPKAEINGLFSLAENYLTRAENSDGQNVKVVVSGDISALPKRLGAKIAQTVQNTRNNTGLCVNLCINYGGQSEIAHAFEVLQQSGKKATTENLLHAMYVDLPPVDLIVRTGGEKRLSNFMLYQGAYAELYFSDTLWPDFTADELYKIFENYAERTRKFGAVTK